MRKLFTFTFALFATVAMNAQDVDPSTWQEGEDVSAYLNWGDYDGSFSGDAPFFPSSAGREGEDRKPETLGDWWKGSLPSEYRIVDDEQIKGVYGFYVDGAKIEELIDFYQVLWVPAGFYTFKVQATYRESTNDATFNNWYDGTPKKNAWFYVESIASEDPESDVLDTFETYVRSVMTSGVTDGPLYNEQSGGLSWMNDYKKTYKDKITGETKTVYCPTSTLSAGVYFVNGKYEHEVNVVLEKDGYVRLGMRKTANIAQDWLIFTNFRIIYNGPADDQAKLVLALERKSEAELMIEEICSQIEEQGYSALAQIISEEMFDINADVDESSLASVSEAVAALENLYDQGANAVLLAKRLADLLKMSDDMIETTDYPGKGVFQSTVDAITLKATTEDPEVLNYDVNAYADMFGELATARGTYLQTNDPDENGAWDFTPLVKYPWFVNPEYNPTYKQDPGDEDKWVWSLDEETWLEGMSQGFYADKIDDADNPRTDIASEVTIGIDEDATNQWFTLMNCQGWSPGVRLYYQGHLIGASDGSNSVTGGTMEIRQRVIGLPNGFYSLRALVRGNGNATFSEDNLPEYHNIFAENSQGVVVKSALGHTDSYRYAEYGWNEYKAGAWTEHKTGIIEVSDGELLIGGQSGMVGNFTGFRLFFYGMTPNFSGMVREDMAEVLEMMQTNLVEKYGNVFAGDTLYVVNLMNSILFPVTSTEAYKEAFDKITDAKDYIQKAANAMNNYTLAADYDKLYAKYTDPDAEDYFNGPTQGEILLPAMMYVAELGISPKDQYTDIAVAKDVYNAYKSYLTAYDKGTALDEPELKELMATQAATLKAGYSNADQLKQFETDINFLVQRATILAAGGKNASETSPVEITSLINNPDFEKSSSSGWSGNTGTSNEYARGNSEIWNTNPIDMYQVIKGLPAGKYEIRVRALYRDARNVRDNSNQSWTSYWVDANGDVNAWARHYAELYARTVTNTNDTIESAAYVKSVCDGKFTKPTFTKYYRNNSTDLVEGDMIVDDQGNETGVFATDTIWTYSVPEDDMFDDDDELITTWTDDEGKVYSVAQEGPDYRYVFSDENGTAKFAWQIEDTYPFDERIKTTEGVFYYPSSMLGAYYRFDQNPEAYCNTIQIEVPAGSDLRIGFRKSTSVSGDWVIFDDFQLFYLGGDLDKKPEIPESINELAANKAKSAAIYNVAGQRVNALQKGLNIVGGKKVYVK
jgi:hypothetical protein